MVVSKRWASWSTRPTTVRSSSPSKRSNAVPFRVTSPDSVARKRSSTAARVDLPDPLGPTTATRRPGDRSRSIPRRADVSASG